MILLLRLVNAVDVAAKYLALTLTTLVLVVMLAQVFFRYVLNSSLQWSEELAVWGMIWMVFIGSVLLQRHGEHIGITTFVRVLPLRLRVPLIVFSKIATLAFTLIIAYYGIQVFTGTFHANSPSLGISTRWIKLAIPVGAALMVIPALYAIGEDLRRLILRDYDSFRHVGTTDQD